MKFRLGVLAVVVGLLCVGVVGVVPGVGAGAAPRADSFSFDSRNGVVGSRVGGEVGVYVPGDFFGIQGTLLGDITIGIDPTFSSPLINSTVKIEPLVIEGSLKVFWLNPDNTVNNLTGKYNLLDPLESQPFKTLDLTQFQ